VTDPAVTMRRAADHIRGLGVDVVYERLADLLDDAANDAEEVGPSAYAERAAAALLGLPDPYPRLRPPARPEATVTHVEGVPQ
jgi:DNA-directed RNA polymerase specialized sigma24 family protein